MSTLVVTAGLCVLSACGTDGGTPAAQADVAETSAPESSAPAEATTSAPACADLTGEQAVQRWVEEVPRHPNDYEWDADQADAAGYDPCAPLSWVTLPIKGATGSSPYAIMLFHRGTYVGPATEEVIGYHPDVSRMAADAVSATYTYNLPGESTAGASGRATALFTWDDATNSVVRTGEIPPGYDEPETTENTAPSDTDSSGSAPDGSTKITAIRPATQYSRETAVIVTPSGNIGCDLSSDYAGCGVTSYIEDHTDPETDAAWWFDLDSNGPPRITGKGDAPYFEYGDHPAQVVPYGSTVHYLHYVCTSKEAGLTCRNTSTGHGVTMSREGYDAF